MSYLEELWRADTVVKAHDDVEEVGPTTLGTRVATGVALGFIFSAWVFPAPSVFAAAHAANLMIASNTCGADESDETCVAELAAGFANGSHFLKDDFPAPVPEREYFADFADGNPARCNAVTAPSECTSQALEDLDG